MSKPNNVIQPYPPSTGNWDCQCARCGSSADWNECVDCGGEGVSGHDCYDDCCCCAYPEDNISCDFCRGHGGFYACLSSHEWCEANFLPGRGGLRRGEIEWFPVEGDGDG